MTQKIYNNTRFDNCYEVVDLGVRYPDYFQGFECSYTPFDNATYGIGDSFNEALDDALEQVFMGDLNEYEKQLFSYLEAQETLSEKDDIHIEENEENDGYYHVGVRWVTSPSIKV